MWIALAFILSGLFPLWAHCGELTESYRSETLEVLEGLKQKGVWQIACDQANSNCLYTEDLIQSISSGDVKWVELPEFQKVEGATRFSAFNAPELKTIFLNQSVQEIPGFVGLVGFHEVIGLYGKNDRGFHASTAAAQILAFNLFRTFEDLPADRIIFDRLKESIRRYAPLEDSFEPEEDKVLMRSGGAVIGGGGGDTRVLSLRLQVYNYLRRDMLSVHKASSSQGGITNNVSNFYQYYNQLPIDITPSADTSIRYEFDDFKLPKISRILVPRNLFEGNRDAVVSDIALMYSSVGIGPYLFSALEQENWECRTPDKKKTFQVDRVNLAALHPRVPLKYVSRLKEDQALIASHTCRKIRWNQ